MLYLEGIKKNEIMKIFDDFHLRYYLYLFILTTLFLTPAFSVDESKFKKCNQSGVCRRYEKFINYQMEQSENEQAMYQVAKQTIQVQQNGTQPDVNGTSSYRMTMDVVNVKDQSILNVLIEAFSIGVVRVIVDEKYPKPLYTRFRCSEEDVLNGSLLAKLGNVNAKFKLFDDRFILRYDAMMPRLHSRTSSQRNDIEMTVDFNPFKIGFAVNGKLAQTVNSENLMNFEKYRMKRNFTDSTNNKENDISINNNDKNIETGDQGESLTDTHQNVSSHQEMSSDQEASDDKFNVIDAVSLDDQDIWSHYFGGETDEIRLGPSAVGIDVHFHNTQNVYGIPEHSTKLNLPEFSEPYRGWNLDVFEYLVDSPMALYGTTPFLISLHTYQDSSFYSGFLWLNPSETWTRIKRNNNKNNSVFSNFISETGVLDFFFFPGPDVSDILLQYHYVTGFPSVAPLFSIAKHQCRWNYNDEQDVLSVDAGFDHYEIPYDVIWLDIEHTDGRKYFTWHSKKFPDPSSMIKKLSEKSRKLVAIVDPHIKKETGYSVYDKLLKEGALLRLQSDSPNSFGDVFEGWCWPGTSVYPDFLDSRVRQIFGQFYLSDHWIGSSDDLMVWNDMNEPSVFNKPELTCPASVLHLSGREHRELHNLYGMSYTRTTYEALLNRNPNQRPFVLSRSFFIGSHRYGALWTGDNKAEWEHLSISVPMILSHALAGMSFIGADVGGFFGDPNGELLTRWSQLGIWYPFYRDHSHLDAKRREPWLFDDATLGRIRAAVQIRYRLLPQWYTSFMEYSLLGIPVIRPIWWWNKSADSTQKFENSQFWFGDSIMVVAITTPIENKVEGKLTAEIYLPNKNDYYWFNFHTKCSLSVSNNNQTISRDVDLDTSPVYVTSGSIHITKDRIRRSSKQQLKDPSTSNTTTVTAKGRVFIDDGNTYDFRQTTNFVYDELQLSGDSTKWTLKSSPIAIRLDIDQKMQIGKGTTKRLHPVNVGVEKIVIYGVPNKAKQIQVNGVDVVFFLENVGCASKEYTIIVKKPKFQNMP